MGHVAGPQGCKMGCSASYGPAFGNEGQLLLAGCDGHARQEHSMQGPWAPGAEKAYQPLRNLRDIQLEATDAMACSHTQRFTTAHRVK